MDAIVCWPRFADFPRWRQFIRDERYRFGSVFVPYFFDGPAVRYEDLLANDTARDAWFRRTMAERGVFMVPTALKRNHVSAAHTDADIDRTLELAREVLRELPA